MLLCATRSHNSDDRQSVTDNAPLRLYCFYVSLPKKPAIDFFLSLICCFPFVSFPIRLFVAYWTVFHVCLSTEKNNKNFFFFSGNKNGDL